MNSGAETRTDAPRERRRMTGTPTRNGWHAPRRTRRMRPAHATRGTRTPRAALSDALALIVRTPLHPLLRGVTAVSITRAGLQTRSASCPFPPSCGGSGSLHEAIRELTAAGQSGTLTPFPINRREANPDAAKVTLPPQSAKGNAHFLTSRARGRTSARGQGGGY